MATTKEATSRGASAAAAIKPPVIVDLGRKSRKKIKKLKKGEGALLSDISDTVELLQADGKIDKNAQIVVAVVERNPEDIDLGKFWN